METLLAITLVAAAGLAALGTLLVYLDARARQATERRLSELAVSSRR